MPLLSRIRDFFYEAPRSDAAESPPQKRERGDSGWWVDPRSGMGGSDDPRLGMYFAAEIVNDRQAIEMVRGSWLADRVTGLVVLEAMRPGFEVQIAERTKLRSIDGDEVGEDKELAQKRQADVAAEWRRLKVFEVLGRALLWERIEGGAAILLGLSDGKTRADQPARDNAKLEWLRPLHAIDLYPARYYTDPFMPKFGEVELWHVMPNTRGVSTALATPQIVVHESRLVVLPGRQVTDEILHGQLPGFGDSVLNVVVAAIRRFSSGLDGMEITARKNGMPWLKLENLAELLTADGGKIFQARLAALHRTASQIGLRVVDKQDEFGITAAPLEGYRAIYEAFRDEVSAAAGIPKMILFGDVPGGIGDNSTGPKRDWYDSVAAWTTRHLLPRLEVITGWIMRGLGGEPVEWKITQLPLWQASRKEQVEADKIDADTDVALVGAGVVSRDEVRRRDIWRKRYMIEDGALDGLDVGDVPDDIRELAGEPAPVDAETPVQATAMNGAQVASLLGIVRSVTSGEIPRESGIEAVMLAFPTTTREHAARLMGPEVFEAPAPPAPGAVPTAIRAAQDAPPTEGEGDEGPEDDQGPDPEDDEPEDEGP